MFSNIYETAEEGTSDPPVRFLTRYDKSATNIKDSQLWIGIGQVPWATAYSKWYHQYIAYPIQALTAAILLDEYTITDRGTYLSISTELQNQTTIYKAAIDEASDPLLNPAHMLVGKNAKNEKTADQFVQWVISDEGQKVITGFKKNGQQLYTEAPANKTAPF
jgi:ABC-type tungstate transport system permease subunit